MFMTADGNNWNNIVQWISGLYFLLPCLHLCRQMCVQYECTVSPFQCRTWALPTFLHTMHSCSLMAIHQWNNSEITFHHTSVNLNQDDLNVDVCQYWRSGYGHHVYYLCDDQGQVLYSVGRSCRYMQLFLFLYRWHTKNTRCDLEVCNAHNKWTTYPATQIILGNSVGDIWLWRLHPW